MLFFYIWITLQIVLESLPVSSSGHLQLLEMFLTIFYQHCNNFFVGFKYFFAKSIPIDTLAHVLHAPTVLIISCFFYTRWMFLLKNVKKTWPIILKIIFLTGIADSITALFFLLFKCAWQPPLPLGLGFFITGCVLYSLRFCPYDVHARWSWRSAVIIGVVQGFALLPGISRFASVYVAARWLGLSNNKSFEITWLVQWPLIFAASMQGIYALYTHNLVGILMEPGVLGVTAVATFVGYLLLRWAAWLSYTNSLWRFSYYMILPLLGWFLMQYKLVIFL